MIDSFPKRNLLSATEIRLLLSFDRTTWYEFLRDPNAGFPRPVVVGRTANGKPRHRWRKLEVYAWIESLQHDTEPIADEGRKKKS